MHPRRGSIKVWARVQAAKTPGRVPRLTPLSALGDFQRSGAAQGGPQPGHQKPATYYYYVGGAGPERIRRILRFGSLFGCPTVTYLLGYYGRTVRRSTPHRGHLEDTWRRGAKGENTWNASQSAGWYGGWAACYVRCVSSCAWEGWVWVGLRFSPTGPRHGSAGREAWIR